MKTIRTFEIDKKKDEKLKKIAKKKDRSVSAVLRRLVDKLIEEG